MNVLLSTILLVIFVGLGSLHFYWLAGGKWGLQQVVPTKNKATDFRPPPKFATFIVAIVLIGFGLLYLIRTGYLNVQLPNGLADYGYWGIPVIFILRAIGEFQYVGFFKAIKGTEFAKADSKLFSPLCLFIGIIGIVVQLLGTTPK